MLSALMHAPLTHISTTLISHAERERKKEISERPALETEREKGCEKRETRENDLPFFVSRNGEGERTVLFLHEMMMNHCVCLYRHTDGGAVYVSLQTRLSRSVIKCV